MIHLDITSDDSKDSLHNRAPNQVFDLADDIESETDANMVLDLDGISIPSPSHTIVSDIAPIPSSFDFFTIMM